MKLQKLKKIEKQLSEFVEGFDKELGRSERRYWCKQYLTGLLLEGERKSIEPISQRIAGGNEQALQQFVNQSPWSHEAVQNKLIQLMLKRETKAGVLVLDDTALPKKGDYSVGVGRQYCGALGKVANCQSIVTWHYSGKDHFPLLGELFLPQSWIDDKERLNRCGVPKDKRIFREKWKMALQLLDQLPKSLAYEAVVMDAGYGEIREFLGELDRRNITFVAQIPQHHSYWPIDVSVNTIQKSRGRPRQYESIADPTTKPLSANSWLAKLIAEGKKWRTIKLPLKTSKKVKVIAVRVKETISQAFYRPGPERWLLIEQLSDGSHKYYVSNASATTSVRKMVIWAHQRWKIEQSYQQMKEELGLDHFEGRSWRGLHHHLTLCFAAYCFLKLVKTPKNFSSNTATSAAVA